MRQNFHSWSVERRHANHTSSKCALVSLIRVQVEHRADTLESRLHAETDDLRKAVSEGREALLCRVQTDADTHREAHQALHEELLTRTQDLTDAVHTRLESAERTSATECQCALCLRFASQVIHRGFERRASI